MAKQKVKRVGVIKKTGMLKVEKDEYGCATYVCDQNKVNAVAHPKFASRKAARAHIMRVHLLYPYYVA